MIEIRWKEDLYSPHFSVLEYRTLKWRIDASGAINLFPFPIEWDDWKQVPVNFVNRRTKPKKRTKPKNKTKPSKKM